MSDAVLPRLLRLGGGPPRADRHAPASVSPEAPTRPPTSPPTRPPTGPPTGGADAARPAAVDRRRTITERLPPGFAFTLAVYILTRIPILATVAYYLRQNPLASVTAIVLRRDGWWYITIAAQGYSTSLRHPPISLSDGHHNYSDWAFFPGYPLIIRAVHEVTRLPYVAASLVAAGILGFLAVWAMYALGREFGGVRVGQGTALLVAAWPGAAAFTWPYSEGLFVAATAVSLLSLNRRRWVLAGLAGAVATLTRPSGIAVLVAATVVAVVEIARHQEWRALAAPVLSSLGLIAFVVFGWSRTGDLMVWRHAENLWAQQLDFGRVLIRQSWPVLRHPATAQRTDLGQLLLQEARLDLLGAALVVAFLVAAVLRWRRLTVAMVAYSLVSLCFIVGYSQVATRPRTVLALLPGFVWLVAAVPRWLAVAVAVAFVPLTVLTTYAWLWMVTP